MQIFLVSHEKKTYVVIAETESMARAVFNATVPTLKPEEAEWEFYQAHHSLLVECGPGSAILYPIEDPSREIEGVRGD